MIINLNFIFDYLWEIKYVIETIIILSKGRLRLQAKWKI